MLGAVCKTCHAALLSSSLHCGTYSRCYRAHGEVLCSAATRETNNRPNASWRVHPEAAIYCTHVFSSFAKLSPTESKTPRCQKLRKHENKRLALRSQSQTTALSLRLQPCKAEAAAQGDSLDFNYTSCAPWDSQLWDRSAELRPALLTHSQPCCSRPCGRNWGGWSPLPSGNI